MSIVRLLFFFCLSSAVSADIMNLNNFMPTRLEDASPIDAKSFDIQTSAELEQRRQDMITFRPNIRYGLNKDIQLETQGSVYSGGDEGGSGETDFAVQYRFFQKESFPTFSVTPLLVFPTGKGVDSAETGVLFAGTYTLKGTSEKPFHEVHFNLSTRSDRNRASQERGSVETAVFGSSHRLTPTIALIADVALEEQIEKVDYLQVAELGFHIDLGSMNYLALSYSQGFGKSCTRSAALLGFEKQIGP